MCLTQLHLHVCKHAKRKAFTMKTLLFFLYHIYINIHDSWEEDRNKLTPVDSCPRNEQNWKQRSQQFSCRDVFTYHCVLSQNETLYEVCMTPKTITNKVGCPFFYEDSYLFDSSYTKCPTNNKNCPTGNETYETDSLYKFPACFEKISTRNNTGIKNTYAESKDADDTSTSDIGAVVGPVVSLIVIIAVIVLIILLWRKGKLEFCLKFVRTTTRRFRQRPRNDAEGRDSSLEPEIEKPLVNDKTREDHANGANSKVNDFGGTTVGKLGAIFDWTFNAKVLGSDVTIKKDGEEVKAGKRIVMSGTDNGFRLIIFRLQKDDEGKYICSNSKTKAVDTVQLRIEKATRAIYHDECILSLSSIPHILFSIQQAIRHASQAKETTELMSSLDTIKREAYRVLILSYENIKKVQMLSLEIEAVHLNGISEALRRNVNVSGKVSKMVKDIEEGQKIIEETISEVQSVKDLIQSVESSFAKTFPTLSEDMAFCHKNLKNLFTKWTSYESFFSSMSFVIRKGRSLTSDQDANALTPYDLGVLHLYVSSVRCSTSYYAVIYMSEIRKLLDDFFADELINKENIDILPKRIQEQYDEMYDRDSRGSDNRAIPYTESETTPSIEVLDDSSEN